MGRLIDGDDGLPAEDVGVWAKEKHEYLCRYIDISRAVRSGWTAPGKAGATFIDPFCGPGRAKVRETGEWIDGGAVAAWKKSCEGGAPFQYWRDKVASRQVWPSTEMRLITGSKNQPLYWLLLAAKHELAHKFWATASNVAGQGKLF